MDTRQNARLTPKGREEMVRSVVDGRLTQAAAARRYNTTPKTVGKCTARPSSIFHMGFVFAHDASYAILGP
jgi:hypothetical protein